MTLETAFVTGASGFIGRHLVERLVAAGCEVRCLVRPASPAAGAAYLTKPGVVKVAGSLTEPEKYGRALEGCDTVFHLGGLVAAPSKADLFAANGTGTGLLAEACAALPTPPRVVYVSSLAAAGPPPPGREYRVENDPPAPVSDYGRSKLAGERELERRADRLPATVISPGIVYGPGDPKSAAIFRAISRTRVHVTVGYRTPQLSLIHADDLVEMLLVAADRGERLAPQSGGGFSPRGRYLACDDRSHPTYHEFGRLVARALGHAALVLPLPAWAGHGVGLAAQTLFRPDPRGNMLSLDKIREATARSWACSGEKARSQLGFRPARSLEERLAETAAWYRSEGWL